MNPKRFPKRKQGPHTTKGKGHKSPQSPAKQSCRNGHESNENGCRNGFLKSSDAGPEKDDLHDEEEDDEDIGDDEHDWDEEDEEDDDQGDQQDDKVKCKVAVANAPSARNVVSELQSRYGTTRRGTYIPDWAELITSDYAERSVLGKIDYFLGLDKKGKYRARNRFLYVDEKGRAWYVVTLNELAKTMRATNRDQMFRALERLVEKKYVIKKWHQGPGGPRRWRLCWKKIEADFVAAGGHIDD